MINIIKKYFIFLIIFSLMSCGGDDDSSLVSNDDNSYQLLSPVLTSMAAMELIVGANIGNIIMVNNGGGDITSCTASSLPSGMSFSVSSDRSSCMISGAPNVVSATSEYQLTARNSAGFDSVSVLINVQQAPDNLAAPQISLSKNRLTLIAGTLMPIMTTANTGGAVSRYSIKPVMSNGLNFDINTGSISGTPLIATPEKTYTVTATNGTGSDSATLVISVENAPNAIRAPEISVSRTNVTLLAGNAMVPITLTNSGGSVSRFSISPLIDNGLQFDSSTGSILGTPQAIAGEKIYVITATNDSGTDSATVAVTVNDSLSVVADNDKSVTSGTIVNLNCQANGVANAKFVWRQLSGTSVQLFESTTSKAGFVAPDVESQTEFVFQVTATDDNVIPAQNATDLIKVTVSPRTKNASSLSVRLQQSPMKTSYPVGEQVSFVADLGGKTGVSVDFYVNNSKVSTATAAPYQFLWVPNSSGNYTVKAIASDGNETKEAEIDGLLAVQSSSNNGLVVTTSLSAANWNKVTVTVTNNGSDEIDINKGKLIYSLPSSVNVANNADTYNGLAWLGTMALGVNRSEENGDATYQINYNYPAVDYDRDTSLANGESFSLRVSDNSANPITQSIYDSNIKNKVTFITAQENATAKAKIQLPTQPSGLTDSSTAIYILNNGDNTVSKQSISWSSDYTILGLEDGKFYSVWAEPIIQGNELFTPNYHKDAVFQFSADKENQTDISINYSSSQITKSTVSLNFSGIPSDGLVDVVFNSELSDEANLRLSNVAVNQNKIVELIPGDYKLTIGDYKATDGSFYIANIPSELDVSGNSELEIGFQKFEFGDIPGLPNYLTMGTITSNNRALDTAFRQAKINALFRYAGPGGNGDRGQIVDPRETRNAIAQARAIEEDTRKVMPIMVVYTAEASGGGGGEADIVIYDNLLKHNINLIRIVRELQSNKDATHPKPGGIIMNADFLGVLQQSDMFNPQNGLWRGGKWYGPLRFDEGGINEPAIPAGGEGRIVEVSRSLQEAIDYVALVDGAERITVPQFEDNLFGYFQMQNYIIKMYGPDVVFGWMENVWSIGSADWVHTVRGGESEVKSVASLPVANFLKQTGIYGGLWKPDFIVFDKYERDGFGSTGRRDYAWNHNDWQNYLYYTRDVAKELETSLMLWQIPGGHMPTTNENITNFDIAEHGASPAPYFFGDDRINAIDDLRADFQALELGGGVQSRIDAIYHGHRTVGAYLRESPYDWTQSNLQKLVDYGVSSILWGGGSTTSVVPLDGSTGDDDGWLLNKVNNYYQHRISLDEQKERLTVDAGIHQIVEPGATVSLSGHVTADNPIASYHWTASAPNLLIQDNNNLNASFIAPNNGANLTLTLTVTDNTGKKASATVSVKVKESQAALRVSASSVSDEVGESIAITLSGGSGTGQIQIAIADSSKASATMVSDTLNINLLSQGQTSLTLMKLGDDNYADGNLVSIAINVSASSKLGQASLSVSPQTYQASVGDSFSFTTLGGSGSGSIVATSNNTSIATVSGNSVTLNAAGNANISIYRNADANYLPSNTVNIAVSVTAATTSHGLEASTDITTGKITILLTNSGTKDLTIRDAKVTLASPIALTSFDLSPVNSATSYPSKSIDSNIQENAVHLTVFSITYPDGNWVDDILERGSSLQVNIWTDTTGLNASDFTIRNLELMTNNQSPEQAILALPNPDDPIDLNVAGWGSCLAMGTVTDASNSSSVINSMANAKVQAIFKYAGDGFGDRSNIILPTVTENTINQARNIEQQEGAAQVLPVMVVYTAQASSAVESDTDGVAGADIINQDNLYKHFINLIRIARKLQDAKDNDHPNPGSIILNPDLLGEWLLNSYRTPNEFDDVYGNADTGYTSIAIRTALNNAINYLITHDGLQAVGSLPAEITNDVLGFVQSQNFVIRYFAPDVTFGWQQNIWPLGDVGSANWVHQRFKGNRHLWNDVTVGAAKFLDDLGVYKGSYKPDFLVFDKYERDGLSGAAKFSYAYNSLDWQNYLLFVKQLTDYLNTPAMLWQIPGGHMEPVNSSAEIELPDSWISTHSATGGTFFMGDKDIGQDIDNIKSSVLNIPLSPSIYNGASNVREYLNEDANYDWGQQRLREAAFSNVFAILWGGGDTTAVTQVASSGDDGGWLSRRVRAYYDNGCMPLYSNRGGDFNQSVTNIVPGDFDNAVIGKNETFNQSVLLAQLQAGESQRYPSNVYKWHDFLRSVKVMHDEGVANFKLWLGGDANETDSQGNATSAEKRAKYGLINLAAFLAQSMKETIQYNACDENNWSDANVIASHDPSLVGTTVYPMTSACGQLGQDYASYGEFSDGTRDPFICPRNPKMEISAKTHATWYGAPAPLFAAPNSALEYEGLLVNGKVGRWDSAASCDKWPPPATEENFILDTNKQVYLRGNCRMYNNQKGGDFVWDGTAGTAANDNGSLEGCGWWGRGVIQTTGRANFGKLNHFLGRSHLDPDDPQVQANYPAPADPIYADLDLCSNPELICSSTKHPELKWVAGLFYWMSEVQEYSDENYASFNYRQSLKEFVDNGMTDNDTDFIGKVSGIVNRGCPSATACPAGKVDGLNDRVANFDTVLKAMGLR